MAAAVQHNCLWNSQKTVNKTFGTSGRPTQYNQVAFQCLYTLRPYGLTLFVVEPERLLELLPHLLLVLLDQEASGQNAKFLEFQLTGT